MWKAVLNKIDVFLSNRNLRGIRLVFYSYLHIADTFNNRRKSFSLIALNVVTVVVGKY